VFAECPEWLRIARQHHYLCAHSLVGTLEQAGESREEYKRHLARFERVLAPPEGEPWLPNEQKLARAAADTAWRRLRVHRVRARYLAEALVELFERASRLDWHPAQAREVAGEVLALHVEEKIGPHAAALNKRFERVLRVLAGKRFPKQPPFQFITSISPSERGYERRSVKWLSNPWEKTTEGRSRELSRETGLTRRDFELSDEEAGASDAAPGGRESSVSVRRLAKRRAAEGGASPMDDAERREMLAEMAAAAGTVWRRIEQHANWERQRMAELLDALAAQREAENQERKNHTPAASSQESAAAESRAVMMAVVVHLIGDMNLARQTPQLIETMRHRLGEILVSRYGEGPEYELFTREPTLMEQVSNEIVGMCLARGIHHHLAEAGKNIKGRVNGLD
jgi:hypothetical protein